jgi:2-polyprenyl-6-methoxyphenol hydroxylase-like FAD-dependent oxidoreductase
MIHTTRVCVVGGGPAGIMLGYLLARAGIASIVLEKHADFLRDFRGDTVHPSTLRLLDELGLLASFLERPHQRLEEIGANVGGDHYRLADFSHLPSRHAFIAVMPQWDFLDFLADQAAKLPDFELLRSTEAIGLIKQGDRVTGVEARRDGEEVELHADLVIGCDGRSSTIRAAAGLIVKTLGAPIDVFWFRVPRDPDDDDNTLGRFMPGRFMVTINRGDYWQCAWVIPKGGADAVRAEGIDQFRAAVASVAPRLAPHLQSIASFDDVKLLSVAVDRLERWSRPGVLCIGDAAHAMSPIGGVGINLAIQDAVATANLLVPALRAGIPDDGQLDAIRRRRLFPVRVVQRFQLFVQDRFLAPALGGRLARPPLLLVIANRFKPLRHLLASFIGIGVRAEHIRT